MKKSGLFWGLLFILTPGFSKAGVETAVSKNKNCIIVFKNEQGNGESSDDFSITGIDPKSFCDGKKDVYIRQIDKFMKCTLTKNTQGITEFKFRPLSNDFRNLQVFDFCFAKRSTIERFKKAEITKELKLKATEILTASPYRYKLATESSGKNYDNAWTYYAGDKGTHVIYAAIKNKDFSEVGLEKAKEGLNLREDQFGKDFYYSVLAEGEGEDTIVYKNELITLLLRPSSQPFVLYRIYDSILADADGDGFPEVEYSEGGDGHFTTYLDQLEPMRECILRPKNKRYISVAGARVREYGRSSSSLVQVLKYNTPVCLEYPPEGGESYISLPSGLQGVVPNTFLMEKSTDTKTVLNEIKSSEKSKNFKLSIQWAERLVDMEETKSNLETLKDVVKKSGDEARAKVIQKQIDKMK